MTAIMTTTTERKRNNKPINERIIDIMEGGVEITPSMQMVQLPRSIQCEFFKGGDYIMIDRSKTELWESGVFCFEYEGDILVRQIQIVFSDPKVIRSVFMFPYLSKEFKREKMNVIGEVVGRYTKIHGALCNW